MQTINTDYSFKTTKHPIQIMSLLNEALKHLAREAPRYIVQYCKEHQVLEKTGEAISQTARQVVDTVNDPNKTRANISKNLGLERCSRCGRKIEKYQTLTTISNRTYCSKCL